MTVKELFDWAVKNEVEDYEIEVPKPKDDEDALCIWTKDLYLEDAINRHIHTICLG